MQLVCACIVLCACIVRDRCQIKDCIGFIDDTHIKVSEIPNGDTDFVNRKGYAFVKLQLVVDHSLLITDANVFWSGSVQDS